jgi:hypothetical protein
MRWWWLAVSLGAGCSTVAHGDYFEEVIEAALKEKGMTVEARCPDAIPLGRVADNHFVCDLDDGSAVLAVKVSIDESGKLSWEQQGEIQFEFDPDALEISIRNSIKKQIEVDVTVDCGVARAADADGTWSCKATANEDGTSKRVLVKNDGSWQVVDD